MGTTTAIARRELASFFNSPIAYIVLCIFLLVGGWLYFWPVFLGGEATMRPYFSVAPLLLSVFAPAITMRLIAEEKKSGTIELLLTMPVEDWQVVGGKFLAALGTMCVGLACTVPYALSISQLTKQPGSFDWGPVFAGYFGLVLLAGTFLAVGLWASALSRNQIVGLIIGFALCFSLWLVDKVAIFFPESIAAVLQYLSVAYHFDNIARGVLDTRDLLFYLTVTGVALLLTTRALATSRR